MDSTGPANPETSAAIDALAIMLTAARQSGADDAWSTAMQTAYGSLFDEIVQHAAVNLATALTRSSVRIDSAAARAARDGASRSVQDAVTEFYKLQVGALLVSARLLERLIAATGQDPDELLRSVAADVRDA